MDQYQEIAPFYDVEHERFGDDIEFYRHALPPGSVLEVGAGTGRLTGPLAAEGFEVWAVEPSEAMLSRARARLGESPAVHLVLGRMQETALARPVTSAIIPLNTLWHAADLEDQIALLRAVRRSVVPAGLLLVDMTNPYTMADRGAAGEMRLRFRGTCERGDVACWSAAWDDPAEQRLRVELFYDVTGAEGQLNRFPAQLALRYVYQGELALMLAVAGFRERAVYGSYDLDPYDSESPNLIAVAEAV